MAEGSGRPWRGPGRLRGLATTLRRRLRQRGPVAFEQRRAGTDVACASGPDKLAFGRETCAYAKVHLMLKLAHRCRPARFPREARLPATCDPPTQEMN